MLPAPQPDSLAFGDRPPQWLPLEGDSKAKPRALHTVNQVVRVDLEPKPERKGNKQVSFFFFFFYFILISIS